MKTMTNSQKVLSLFEKFPEQRFTLREVDSLIPDMEAVDISRVISRLNRTKKLTKYESNQPRGKTYPPHAWSLGSVKYLITPHCLERWL